METIIDKIEKEMLIDSEDREHQSERMIKEYEEATLTEKERINNIFVCLCGYSFQTLLKKNE